MIWQKVSFIEDNAICLYLYVLHLPESIYESIDSGTYKKTRQRAPLELKPKFKERPQEVSTSTIKLLFQE